MACSQPICAGVGCYDCSTHAPECLGNATAFPANPVVAGATIIEADHINRMRLALDAERARRLQTSCGITGWSSKAVGSIIEGSDFDDLKICNNNLQWFSGDGDELTLIPDHYDVGEIIFATQINNLMTAINQNEVRCMCDTDCGADDYCACDGDCGSCNYT